jgi:hypothetical protein
LIPQQQKVLSAVTRRKSITNDTSKTTSIRASMSVAIYRIFFERQTRKDVDSDVIPCAFTLCKNFEDRVVIIGSKRCEAKQKTNSDDAFPFAVYHMIH